MSMDFSFSNAGALLTSGEAWIALATLTLLELVLGIDNVIFISILAGRLPAEQQPRARRMGLGVAAISRLALLFGITWIMRLTSNLFSIGNHGVSGRDLILIGKAVSELHAKVEGGHADHAPRGAPATFVGVVAQILVLDMVFALDSIITSVGMVQ